VGRGRDFRGGGKGRGPYQEEAVAPSSASDRHQSRPLRRESFPTDGAAVDATVKWFNPIKGFGFAEIADGSGDAFLHVKVIEAFGRESVSPGDKMSVFVGQGQKGRQITKVLSIADDAKTSLPPRNPPTI
jgi:CspA family cold shock protein